MPKLILSYVFKTNLAEFRSAVIDDDTDRICRILDIERDYLNKQIDSKGNTALLLAIEYASPLTVRLLLDQGAHPDQPNRITLQTPLGLVASIVYEDYHSYKAQRTLEMAKILLDHGAYIDKPSFRIYRDEHNIDYTGKETSLMISVRKRNLPLTKLLIERKANVNYAERQTQIRAIHFAIANGDEPMYDLLENAGALSCSIITYADNTLLHWFCYKKENDEQINLLDKLLDKGCDINAQNWEQRTPLMIAVKNNMTETCCTLLKNRADIDKRDLKGNQAIDLSIPGSECSKLLLQQVQLKSISTPNEKVLWRKRIDPTRRHSSPLSDMNNSQCIVSISPDNEKKQIHHLYVYPKQRNDSEESEHRYQSIWQKIQTSPKLRVLNNFYKQRTHSNAIKDRLST